MNAKLFLTVTLSTLALVLNAQSANAAAPESVTLSQRVILTMPGKGSSVAYDFGAIARLAEALPGLRDETTILTGSSSGSVVAGFFGLRGINAQSLQEARQLNDLFDRSLIRKSEEVVEKLGKMIANKPTEMDHETLRRGIACVLGVPMGKQELSLAEIAKRSQLTFKLPVVIVAANHEILWDREANNQFKNLGHKTVDYSNFSVSWKPDVRAFYQANPKRFAAEQPDLVLGENAAIGKACTYFVTEDMYEAMKQIPASERLGDLRVMKTPEDLMLAILASVSEPTYYRPMLETDYAKLHVGERLGDRGTSKRRLYAGGFIMPVVAHDVRRAFPVSTVVCTGSLGYPAQARRLLRTWYVIDHAIVQKQNDFWIDFTATPDVQAARKLAFRDVSAANEFRLGYEITEQSLRSGAAIPKEVIRPQFRSAVGAGAKSEEMLVTMRGIRSLVANDQ